GAFTCSVRTQETGNFSLCNFETQVTDRSDPSIFLRQPLYFDHEKCDIFRLGRAEHRLDCRSTARSRSYIMKTSYLNDWNADLLDQYYERWKQDHASVDSSWSAFFEGFELGSSPNRDGKFTVVP